MSSGCCGAPGPVGAVSCPLQRPVLWVRSHETCSRGPGSLQRNPYKALVPCLPPRITGTQGAHLLQGRGRDKRENRELFREGVEGRDTKIRPLVPKKTLAPTKALERGSSARNVTPGSTPTGLGNEVSLRDQWGRPMASGHGHLSPQWPRLPNSGAGSNCFLSAPSERGGKGAEPPVSGAV